MLFDCHNRAQHLETDKNHIAELHNADDGQCHDHLHANVICAVDQVFDLLCGPGVQRCQKLLF